MRLHVVEHQQRGPFRQWNQWSWAPFHERLFHRNSNSMEISLHSHLNSNPVIATNFCTWRDICAAVACAKNCCDLIASNGITARRNFHRIWIAGKKLLVNGPLPHALEMKWNKIPNEKSKSISLAISDIGKMDYRNILLLRRARFNFLICLCWSVCIVVALYAISCNIYMPIMYLFII